MENSFCEGLVYLILPKGFSFYHTFIINSRWYNTRQANVQTPNAGQ